MEEVDIARAKIDPRGVFSNPRDVLGLTGIDETDRFIILWRWRAQAKKDGDRVHAKNLKRMIFELEQATIDAR
ncbi:MAG: hypothetical protein GC190_03765 [Alphaproteobacteria bacterium]|nr:hypothetical protein [Alphaproteobacteria bacterium]